MLYHINVIWDEKIKEAERKIILSSNFMPKNNRVYLVVFNLENMRLEVILSNDKILNFASVDYRVVGVAKSIDQSYEIICDIVRIIMKESGKLDIEAYFQE